MSVLVLLATLSFVVMVITLVVSPFWGIALAFIVKPIIDVTWNTAIAGVRLTSLAGVAVPLLLLPRVLFGRNRREVRPVVHWVAAAYLISQVFGSYMLLVDGDTLHFVELWSRALNGYLGFFLFAGYFRKRQDLRILLLALIVAGIFPLMMGIWQNLTGAAWEEQMVRGELVRQSGLYHDIFNFRFYAFQTIAAIILYWTYFKPQLSVRSGAYLVYLCSWMYVTYHTFSKAAIAILVAWWLIWFTLNRKYAYLVVGIVLAIGLVTFATSIRESLFTLFAAETGVMANEEKTGQLFEGRGGVWQDYAEEWKSMDLATKLRGTGQMRALHNEWLRVLQVSGLIGLAFHVCVLAYMALALSRLVYTMRSPMNIVAVMVFAMYLIDCIGLHPGWYPAYQWFVWGIIGLALTNAAGDRIPGRFRGHAGLPLATCASPGWRVSERHVLGGRNSR